MSSTVIGKSDTPHVPAVRGDGVNLGIIGTAEDGWAVSGESKKQVGVRGICDDGWGVSGDSKNQVGVRGSCDPGWGVAGQSKTGVGVLGQCDSGSGVAGNSNTGTAVEGKSKTGSGVSGISEAGYGVYGETRSHIHAAIVGVNRNSQGPGIAVYGKKEGAKGDAGFFDGNVTITGNLTLQGVSIQTWLQRIIQLEKGANAEQLSQRLTSLDQKVTSLQNQVNTAVSNLTGRVTQTEFAISDLKAKVQQIINQLG